MKRTVFASAAIFAAASAFAGAIAIVSPKAGDEVKLLTDRQREFVKMSRAERAVFFDDSHPEKEKEVTHIRSYPRSVLLQWEGKGRFSVAVTKKGADKPFVEATVKTNRLYVSNLEIGCEYSWTVRQNGDSGTSFFRTEDLAPRLIGIPGDKGLRGVPNFRDIGGRMTSSGRRVRQGMAYRSAGLNNNASVVMYTVDEVHELEKAGKLASMGEVGKNLSRKIRAGQKLEKAYIRLVKKGPTEQGSARLTERWRRYITDVLGIKTDIDLRSDGERFAMKESPLGPSVAFVHDWDNYRGYSMVHTAGKEATKKIFRMFMDKSTYPVVFHCIGGADRTGTVAALLEGVLGVSDEDIWLDYQITAWQGGVNDARHLGWFSSFIRSFDKFEGDTISKRMCAYFRSIGFSEADLERIRDILLEKPAFED